MLHNFPEMLAETLYDRHLSRGERQAIAQVLASEQPNSDQRAALRSQIFKAAHDKMVDHRDREVLGWLEEMVKLFFAHERDALGQSKASVACFSPGGECHDQITALFENARICVDICVFTITDNRLVRSLIAAHERGVRIRVLSDGNKAHDLGSDIEKLIDVGIEVACDRGDEKHMHHKFAVFDRELLLTGSYNWTRSAAESNNENIVINREAALVQTFLREFENLWQRYRQAQRAEELSV